MKLKIRCDYCGKEFFKIPSRVGEKNYCCRQCLGAANGVRMRKCIIRTCDYCGKEFVSNNKHSNRNKHYFCSRECGWKYKDKRVPVICEWCGKEFVKKSSDISRSEHNFCSEECCLEYRNMAAPQTANQRVAGEVLYRYIAGKKIGRELTAEDEVHHIDGNHMNNKPENLVVVSKSEHAKIHASRKERDEYGRFVKSRESA